MPAPRRADYVEHLQDDERTQKRFGQKFYKIDIEELEKGARKF